MRIAVLAALAGLTLTATPAAAQSRPGPGRGDQERAFDMKEHGRAMPLPRLRERVEGEMGGADYIGPEMHGSRVRMKYMRGPKVIWVDVDARTGRIVNRSDD